MISFYYIPKFNSLSKLKYGNYILKIFNVFSKNKKIKFYTYSLSISFKFIRKVTNLY